MGFWIAIFITLAVFGSVLWVMPSPREKALIQMRHKAMGLGLKVRLVDKAIAGKLFPWLESHHGYVMYEKYHPIGKKALSSKTKIIRLSVDKNAHELDLEEPIRQFLDQANMIKDLPASSEAIALFSGGVALLWRERDEPDGVERIEECLARCVAEIDKLRGFEG